MKLLVSHQSILQKSMRVGGQNYSLPHYHNYKVVLIIILLAMTFFELQLHLSGC